MCFQRGLELKLVVGCCCLKSRSYVLCLSEEKRSYKQHGGVRYNVKCSDARISAMEGGPLRENQRDGNAVPSEMWSSDIKTHPSHLKLNQVDVNQEWELLFGVDCSIYLGSSGSEGPFAHYIGMK